MGYDIAFDEALSAVVVTVRGESSAAMIQEAIQDNWQYRRDHGANRLLWDVRAGSLAQMSPESVRSVSAFQKRRPDLPPSRVAILVSRDVDFGIARMVAGFVVDEKVSVRVFRALDEAREWLEAGDG